MTSDATKREFVVLVGPNGHLLPVDRAKIAELISRFPAKQLKISITRYKKRRSFNQNAFYFGVVIPIIMHLLNEAGNDVDENDTHEFIKDEIWKHYKIVTSPNGEKTKILKTSVDLTTEEWEEKIEKIRSWAAQFDISIPFPNEEN